jgi:hypothetical protein
VALDEVRVKVDRAKDHLNAFKAELDGFVSRQPYPLHVVTKDERSAKVRDVEWTTDIPWLWSAIAGDCVHNLRSTLDHIVFALSGGPGNAPDDSEFPIFLNSDRYFKRDRKCEPARGSGLWKIRGVVADGAYTEFHRLQPFFGSNPTRHPLWIIHELDRLDKHRALHILRGVAYGYASLVDRGIGDASELPLGWRQASATSSHLYRTQMVGMKVKMKVRHDLAVHVSLEPQTVGSHEYLDVLLEKLITFVEEEVIATFAPFL